MLFKTCGVYPFNPKAIQVSNNDNSEVVASEGNADKGNSDNTAENDKDKVEQSFDNIVENDTDKVVHEQPSPNVNFTAEQQELFKHCFEEGYNIFIDPDYVRWLRLHHPESCPADGSDCALNNDSVISHFPDIVSPSPVAIVSMDELISELDTSELAASVLNTEDVTEIPVPFLNPSSGSSTVSLSSVPCLSTSSTPSSSLGTSVHTRAMSPILQQLETPSISSKKGRATPRARLLTSDEFFAQLQEKENKKEEVEEKERKKRKGREKKNP